MSDDKKTTENKELHVCMGLNSCKNLGFTGTNDCAGQGDCSTVYHSCHTLNECKGQGGCGLFGTTMEFCFPSENECRYQGSCGAPILSSRFIAQGPNKGRSVWQLARKRFEEKMTKQNKQFGSPPADYPFGPTNEFITLLQGQAGDHSSCGQSGSRHCSYAPVGSRLAAADARVKASNEVSQAELPEMISRCPASESES